MTIKEIKKKYKNRWILARVLEENKLNQVTHAEVILHNQNKEEIYKALTKVKKGEHICTFYTGEILPKGMAFAFLVFSHDPA